MYIMPRFSLLVASAMRRSVWPSAERGRLGLALTPTTTPLSLLAMLAMACLAYVLVVEAWAPAWVPWWVHSTRGSCTKVSRTLRRVSLLERRTLSVVSQDLRNTPSYPETPMASIMFCVSLNGTTSGFSRARPLSKRHEKSTWTQSPVLESIRTFSPCRSPRPTTWPQTLHTAQLLENFSLASSHELGSEKCCKNHLCSLGGNLSRTLSSSWAWKPCSRAFLMEVPLACFLKCASYMSLICLLVLLSNMFSWMYTSWQQCLNPLVFSIHSIMPQSSVRGITANVLMYKFLEALPKWCDLVASKWFRTLANSIILVSFLRSSLGLQRNLYSLPSLPRTLITLGF
mmetsp:Transcript_4184/g.12199  ORF Transcript_4184/g.12199 Transcript_4184/m.12199 type:complete len:343 (+) Transcript_4184:119-1147(+)